jgi:hypothetical protein
LNEVGRPCSVCTHPERHAIERELVAGAPLDSFSGKFGLSRQAVTRHRDNHLPGAAVAAAEAERAAQRAEEGEDLVAISRALRNKAIDLLHRAEQSGDLRVALAGVREAGRLLETQARLEGKIEAGTTTINVAVTQQFLSVQNLILTALQPFPEARIAVVRALAAAEADAA